MSRRNFSQIDRYGSLGQRPMTTEELMRVAPSIFATEKHDSRSERYAYIPTSAVVEGLRAHGFQPVLAKQGTSRIEGKEAFTKHLVRFRRTDDTPAERKIGGLYPEVVLINSHDGTSAYKLYSGLFRLVCLNGMLVSDRQFSAITIPHKGDVTDQVIEGSYTVLNESRKAIDVAESWSAIRLRREEQLALAEQVHTLRFADSEGHVTTPIRADQLLVPRRAEDRDTSLWNTVNVLQENAIRGGISAMGRDSHNRPRRTTMRPVRGIDGDVRLNTALWALGERMAQIKAQG